MSTKNIEGLKTISKQNKRIFELSKDVQRLSGLQLNYEESKKEIPRLYFSAGLSYLKSNEQYIPNVGIIYLRKKLGFGADIGLIDKNPYFGGKLLISIF